MLAGLLEFGLPLLLWLFGGRRGGGGLGGGRGFGGRLLLVRRHRGVHVDFTARCSHAAHHTEDRAALQQQRFADACTLHPREAPAMPARTNSRLHYARGPASSAPPSQFCPDWWGLTTWLDAVLHSTARSKKQAQALIFEIGKLAADRK